MKPVLYDKEGNAAIGVLEDTLSAAVTERRNSEFTANFTYPYKGSLYSQIECDSVILMMPNQKSQLQKFRVSAISQPLNGIVSYDCEHISYELNSNPIFTLRFDEALPTFIITEILNSTVISNSFYGSSDIDVTKKCEIEFMSARDAIFKLQQYFGGELEWDNNVIALHRSRGTDTEAVISYGVNLLDYTKKADVSNVFTAIAPYMQLTDDTEETDEGDKKKTISLPEKILTYYNNSRYSYTRAKAVDLTSEFTDEEMENLKTDSDYVNALRYKAYEYMDSNLPNDIVNNVTLSYVDLRKAKEFETIETMNDLGLCDTVTLRDERLGVNFKGKIIATKFNVLTEMYDSIEIGNPTQQLLDSLVSIVDLNRDSTTIGEKVNNIEKNIDEYFSAIKVTDNLITFISGNIKDIEGVYNTYKYKIERDTDIQEEGKKGRIISFTDPKNRKTKIIRK